MTDLLSPRVRSRDVVNGDVPAYWKSILQRQWIQMGIWWEKGDCVVLPQHSSVLDEQFYEMNGAPEARGGERVKAILQFSLQDAFDVLAVNEPVTLDVDTAHAIHAHLRDMLLDLQMHEQWSAIKGYSNPAKIMVEKRAEVDR